MSSEHGAKPPHGLLEKNPVTANPHGLLEENPVAAKPHGLLEENPVYKPFRYPWAYDAWKRQHQSHWMPEEVELGPDVQDWSGRLSRPERNLVTQIFRFFTTADVEVGSCYMRHYSQVFRPTEVLMMLAAFSDMETVHIAAYSHLLDTIGMPEGEYGTFLTYQEMRAKFDYMRGFNVTSHRDIARTLAAFAGFTEGMQLFASFAILLNFPRRGLLRGMGQIITWSVRDETLHCVSMLRLFRVFISEHPEVWDGELQQQIRLICVEMVRHEDAFISLAFELGPVEGLSAGEVKHYIRFIANRRLGMMGLDPIYPGAMTNPLPWVEEALSALEHQNFFEGRATEYSKGSTTGTWDQAFQAPAGPLAEMEGKEHE